MTTATEPKLTVFTGPMFSSKTTSLLSAGEKHERAGQTVMYCKPQDDTRVDGHITTHNGQTVKAVEIDPTYYKLHIAEWYGLMQADVILIDEAQFFEDTLVPMINELLNKGKTVYVAGLDLDYQGEPFETMAYLMSYADTVVKLTAICARTGSDARFSHRLTGDNETVLVGGSETYEPLCRTCFTKETRKDS